MNSHVEQLEYSLREAEHAAIENKQLKQCLSSFSRELDIKNIIIDQEYWNEQLNSNGQPFLLLMEFTQLMHKYSSKVNIRIH